MLNESDALCNQRVKITFREWCWWSFLWHQLFLNEKHTLPGGHVYPPSRSILFGTYLIYIIYKLNTVPLYVRI